jgi:hypothetical protein
MTLKLVLNNDNYYLQFELIQTKFYLVSYQKLYQKPTSAVYVFC